MRRGISGAILVGLAVGGLSAALAEDGFSFRPRTAASRFARPFKPLEFFTGRRDDKDQPEEQPLPADVDSNSARRRMPTGANNSNNGGEQSSYGRNRFSDESSLSRYTRRPTAPNSALPSPSDTSSVPQVKNYHRALFGSDPPARGSATPQHAAAEQSHPRNAQRAQQLGYEQVQRRERSFQTIPVNAEEPSRPSRQADAKPAWYEELRKSQKLDDLKDDEPARQLRRKDELIDAPEFPPVPHRTAQREETDDVRLIRAERESAVPKESAAESFAGPTEGNVSPFEQVTAEPPRSESDSPKTLPNWASSKPIPPQKPTRPPTEPDDSPQPLRQGESGTRASRLPAQPAATPRRNSKPLAIHKPFDSPAAPFGNSTAQPSADGQAPAVTVEWVKRSAINVGQECHCDLVVKNNGDVAAQDILVEAYFPDSVRLTKSEPAPNDSTDHLTWRFENLAVGAEKTIQIAMIPSKRGHLATRALVRFTGAAAGTFRVEEPLLKLHVKGPTEVSIGDPASQIVTVSNPGSGTANNVVVAAYIPDGLDHPQGKEVKLAIGSLSAGESRQVRLPLAAVDGGQQRLAIEAEAANALRQVAESRITVVAPALTLELEGPGLRYIGRSADYRLTVRNEGNAATNNVRAVHEVPDGFEFVRADKGGAFDASTGAVNWFLGRVEAGDAVQLHVRLKPSGLGDHVHQAAAFSEHGTRSEAQTETRVDGTAALVLKIADLDDPVEVGVETGYEIRVQNEGTKAAQNVSLSCELPGGVELVSAQGPAEFVSENGLIVFKPLAQLAPGQTATFQVRVVGAAEGNQRFRARLASDSIQEPLIFEESTKFYQD